MAKQDLMRMVTNAIQGGRKIDASAILQQVAARPKATHATAYCNLLETIALVAEKGDNHPESRKAAIEAVGVIANSDSMDIIQRTSAAMREQLESEEAAAQIDGMEL